MHDINSSWHMNVLVALELALVTFRLYTQLLAHSSIDRRAVNVHIPESLQSHSTAYARQSQHSGTHPQGIVQVRSRELSLTIHRLYSAPPRGSSAILMPSAQQTAAVPCTAVLFGESRFDQGTAGVSRAQPSRSVLLSWWAGVS